MIWAMLAGGLAAGLIVGTMAGWMLCALITVGHEAEQHTLICRLRMALRYLVDFTEPYHDDQRLSSAIGFARDLLEKEA